MVGGVNPGKLPELGLYAQTLENSVRQFAITFLGLIGSNPQFEGAFRRLLPVPGLPASHRDRSEFFCHKRYSGRENRTYISKRGLHQTVEV